MSVPIGRGGYLGALINTWLNEHLAFTGGLIFLLAVFSVGLLLSTEYAVIRYLGFATTGGMTLFKALRLQFANGWVRTTTGNGIFTARRTDLPASVTLRDGAPRVSLEGGPIPSFSDLAKRPFNDPPGSAVADDEATDADGPSIRIGRRATSSFSSQDLSGGTKPIGRTDLSVSKSKGKSSRGAKASIEEEHGQEQEGTQGSSNRDEEDWDLVEDQAARGNDLEGELDTDRTDEESLEDASSEDLESEDPSEPIEPIDFALTAQGKLRADPSHGASSPEPRIRNSKNRKKEEEEEERNSLYNSLNDTPKIALAPKFFLFGVPSRAHNIASIDR